LKNDREEKGPGSLFSGVEKGAIAIEKKSEERYDSTARLRSKRKVFTFGSKKEDPRGPLCRRKRIPDVKAADGPVEKEGQALAPACVQNK